MTRWIDYIDYGSLKIERGADGLWRVVGPLPKTLQGIKPEYEDDARVGLVVQNEDDKTAKKGNVMLEDGRLDDEGLEAYMEGCIYYANLYDEFVGQAEALDGFLRARSRPGMARKALVTPRRFHTMLAELDRPRSASPPRRRPQAQAPLPPPRRP
ncbi:unnamed protein product [Parajaminaea phylloscopi]